MSCDFESIVARLGEVFAAAYMEDESASPRTSPASRRSLHEPIGASKSGERKERCTKLTAPSPQSLERALHTRNKHSRKLKAHEWLETAFAITMRIPTVNQCEVLTLV
ncbi:hypothetical protein A0H81_10218 [Grifola frondosa]|uniref:Uncharacterized protein n=1 Tax=Grifola frondosa TaxID=5627 RepID=A0A1C7M0S9_GRIFR|nr:hypothetical protein A0H81_10218 [Grifola frondosa]